MFLCNIDKKYKYIGFWVGDVVPAGVVTELSWPLAVYRIGLGTSKIFYVQDYQQNPLWYITL